MCPVRSANDLWCTDFKGEFKLGNGRYCYPLTVSDQASRFLLMCEALETTREEIALAAFERLFLEQACLEPFAPTMASLSLALAWAGTDAAKVVTLLTAKR